MKKITALIIGFALFFHSTLGVSALFRDVPDNHENFEAISQLEDLNIIKGDEFFPEKSINRGLFAIWMLRGAGQTDDNYTPQGKKRFFDVPVKSQYGPYIYRLADLDVVKGDSKNPVLFNPEKTLTRKDALEWLFNLHGVPVPKVFDKKLYKATDVSVNSANAPLVHKAMSIGMLKPGHARLSAKVSRREAAEYIKKIKESAREVTVTILPSVASDISNNPSYDVMLGAWNEIFKKYLHKEDVDKDKLIYAAIEGMVKELGDKHSDFERPGNSSLLDSLNNQVEGIGAVIELNKEEEVVVVAPIIDSPAERAGLLANDVITKVDDFDVKGKKLTEVVSKIKGKKGTTVKLTVRRDGKLMQISIVRDIVKIISARLKRTTDNYAIITLANFGIETNNEFRKIVDDIVANRPQGIVLDLRNNPGGFLTTAVQLAGYFIKNGEKVAIVRYPDHREDQNSSGSAELAGFKLMILTNGGSASASEILAGALKDYGMGKIIGEKTFGKGTVQEVSNFSDGSTLKITIAEWLTPKERLIDKVGILPDIEIKLTDEDRKNKLDPQMDRALEELRSGR